jgi:type I restriction enzyme S subunit
MGEPALSPAEGGQGEGAGHDLPEGWATSRLAELLKPGGLFDGPFGSNLKTSDYTDAGVRVIRLENIANLRFVEDKHTYISNTKYASLTKHTVTEGDIIVGSFVDGTVRVCVLPPLPTEAIAKADCFCVRTRPELDCRFLAFQLGANRTPSSSASASPSSPPRARGG